MATLRVVLTAPDGSHQTVTQRVTLAAGDNAVTLPLTVAQPQRWQPVGYGKQPLYRVAATLEQDGAATDTAERRIGLRTVELIRDGGAMGFRVNGTPIFAKGANVIPFDSLPTRTTAATMRPAAHRRARRQHEHAAQSGAAAIISMIPFTTWPTNWA